VLSPRIVLRSVPRDQFWPQRHRSGGACRRHSPGLASDRRMRGASARVGWHNVRLFTRQRTNAGIAPLPARQSLERVHDVPSTVRGPLLSSSMEGAPGPLLSRCGAAAPLPREVRDLALIVYTSDCAFCRRERQIANRRVHRRPNCWKCGPNILPRPAASYPAAWPLSRIGRARSGYASSPRLFSPPARPGFPSYRPVRSGSALTGNFSSGRGAYSPFSGVIHIRVRRSFGCVSRFVSSVAGFWSARPHRLQCLVAVQPASRGRRPHGTSWCAGWGGWERAAQTALFAHDPWLSGGQADRCVPWMTVSHPESCRVVPDGLVALPTPSRSLSPLPSQRAFLAQVAQKPPPVSLLQIERRFFCPEQRSARMRELSSATRVPRRQQA